MKHLIRIITSITLLFAVACNTNPKETNIIIKKNKFYTTKHKTINIDGIDIFYREAGNINKPTIVMLHGFPSSSHMYRNVIKSLSDDFHLIAPDYPGFGLSDTPKLDEYDYTFDNISNSIEKLIKQLNIDSYYLMMQDYGGPIGFRIATKNPKAIKGLIIQNANIYPEGLGEWALKIGSFVKNKDFKGLVAYKNYLMSKEGIKEQYIDGAKNSEKISPVSYLTDHAFVSRKGNNEIQTAVFNNYKSNFPKYSEWQQYLKNNQPKTLIVWGINDKFFSKPGGEAYKKDLKNPEIHFFNGGHFMLEEYGNEVSTLIKNFINQPK